MVLRPRTRLQLRRAVVATALGALFVPAAADAKVKAPVITKVTPQTAAVGTTLTLQGKYFRRGKGKNSVLFRRDKGKALFVKADVSTTKKLRVVVPKKLESYMLTTGNAAVPTRFRLRVLAAKLSKAYTPAKLSPLIGPERASSGNGGNSGGAGVPTQPEGDCDSDGVKNRADADDDNDLLSDALELALLLDPCVGDTDGDGVEDGFEYQSAVDLNNDNYQMPNVSLPYPGKTPYPNPLYKDADVDYDGDGLTLSVEQQLWKYTYAVNHTAARTLSPLSYSDGAQYSLSTVAGGRRTPTMATDAYTPPVNFGNWAVSAGYAIITFRDDSTRALLDADRDGYVTSVPTGYQKASEQQYWDLRPNGAVSDDERDEDGDGLTNYDEAIGPMSSQEWWASCYSAEGKYVIQFAGTKAFDADSDGDGILDGADDQDFDDVPNVMELSRNMAGNTPIQKGGCATPDTESSATSPYTWVNPFNPCLPDRGSDTCPAHPEIGSGYPPFQTEWKKYVLN